MSMNKGQAEPSQFLQQFAESLAEGIIIADGRGRITFANRSLEQLLGYGSGGLKNKPWDALFAAQAESTPAAPPPVASDRVQRFKADLQHASGSAVPVLITTYLLSENDSGPTRLSTIVDLGSQQQMLAQAEQMEELASMGCVVSSVVHELNNALTILVLQSQMLSRNNPSSPQFGEYLSQLQDQVKHMTELVGNLRSSVAPREPQLEATDVNGVLRKTLDLQCERLRMSGIEVSLRLDHDLPSVQANPFQLQQVFVNLINNGYQALADKAMQGKLLISTQSIPGQQGAPARIRIRFHDTGPGIPPEIMDRIFEPFFTTKGPGKGMGLGLSICEQIVHTHGGRIWAENDRAGGATFLIELPVLQPESSAAQPDPTPRARIGGQGWSQLPHLTQALWKSRFQATVSAEF